MLNQGQGTYPQLAGSFYNSQQMMPHDNGRNARQVPTFFGGLQNMMSASTAMQNFQGIPMGQGILNTQALASQQYANSMPGVIGGLGTGLGLASMVGSVGGYAAGKAATAGLMPGFTGALGRGMGILAGGVVGGVMAVGGAAAMGIVHAYKKRMSAITDMRNALEGSRLGYGLADPVTGNISNQAALQLSRQMQASAVGSGFKDNDLKNIMGTASGLGMLNGMQSLSQVTKRVVDLAKASKEIVMLGEGISMTDAMQLQKLTQDMGISTNKFRSTNIGKNLVMAARASSMSMAQASQVGGMGAVTYQQLGLGAASGMNAALYGNMASAGLMGVGAFSLRQQAALGGQEGIARSLLAGQASTMSRMSNALVMGAVKLGEDGTLGINRELLDQYTRGEVSREDLIARGKNLGKGMSKGRRNRLMEELKFSMPRLREEMSDSLSSEEQMAIQTRGILELKAKTGMSTRRAAHAYFQDANQAEAYLGYAQNFEAVRGENNRQLAIADQEKMLRYAGMAKSSSGLAQFGRGTVRVLSGAGDLFYRGLGLESAGEYLAEVTTREQDDAARGLRRIMGVSNTVRGAGDLQGLGSYGEALYGAPRGQSVLERVGAKSYSDYFKRFVKGQGSEALADYEVLTRQTSGVNVIGNAGIGQKVEELTEGDYNFSRKLGDFTGIDFGIGAERIYGLQAEATDASITIGKLRRNRDFSMNDTMTRDYYNKAVARLRQLGTKAAQGDGSGDFNGVDSREIYPEKLRDMLAGGYKGDYRRSGGYIKAKIDAAIGQAYRFMSTGDSGKSAIGFASMLEKVSAAGNLTFMGDELGFKKDEIKLAGGTILRSAGLSRAIQESGVSAKDLGKLTHMFMTGGDKLTGYGGARASLGSILSRAGISVGRGEAGRYRGLVDALAQAQLESKDKDGKKSIVDITAGIQGFSGTDEDIAALVSSGQLTGARASYLKEQLDMLDSRIAEGVVGEEGKGLREDLAAHMYRGDAAEDAVIRRRLRESGEYDTEARRSARTAMMHRIATLEADYGSDEAAKKTTASFHRAMREYNQIVSSYGIHHEKSKKFYRTKVAPLRDKIARDKRDMVSLKTKVGQEEFITAQMRKYYDDYHEITDEDRHYFGRNTGGNRGLLGHSSLKSMLDAIGSTEEEKKAYAKLLDSEAGAGLITSFRKMRRGYDELKPEQKRAADKQLLREILAAAERQKINVPGTGQSKSLPELLGEIASGIKDFRAAMSSIAKLNNDGETVTFKLVSKGETK